MNSQIKKLTKSQEDTWNIINSLQVMSKEQISKMCWWEAKKHEDGHISGKFNTQTLRALAEKGYIKVTKDGTGHNYDEFIILR